MGYHDLTPEAFILSPHVQETNTAEDALSFRAWDKKYVEIAKRLMSAQTQGAVIPKNDELCG